MGALGATMVPLFKAAGALAGDAFTFRGAGTGCCFEVWCLSVPAPSFATTGVSTFGGTLTALGFFGLHISTK